jgi:hypothetical protein
MCLLIKIEYNNECDVLQLITTIYSVL